MKNIVKILGLLITITLISCNANLNLGKGVDGSGNIITEKRAINENFDKISSSSGVTVIVEQGTPSDIEVETDDNLMQYVITKVENGTLVVKVEGNINSMSSIDVRIRMSSIAGLESSSGSRISSKNTLKGNTIAVKSSSGSEIEAVLEFEKVSCESSSGSNITVSGKALRLETTSSSGSEIDAGELAANDVISQSSSGSSTSINPIVKLEAKASSGSSIDYVKAPKTIIKTETSGGSVD